MNFIFSRNFHLFLFIWVPMGVQHFSNMGCCFFSSSSFELEGKELINTNVKSKIGPRDFVLFQWNGTELERKNSQTSEVLFFIFLFFELEGIESIEPGHKMNISIRNSHSFPAIQVKMGSENCLIPNKRVVSEPQRRGIDWPQSERKKERQKEKNNQKIPNFQTTFHQYFNGIGWKVIILDFPKKGNRLCQNKRVSPNTQFLSFFLSFFPSFFLCFFFVFIPLLYKLIALLIIYLFRSGKKIPLLRSHPSVAFRPSVIFRLRAV